MATKIPLRATFDNGNNPTGIADHPDLIGTLISLSEELASADDVLNCLEKHFEIKEK